MSLITNLDKAVHFVYNRVQLVIDECMSTSKPNARKTPVWYNSAVIKKLYEKTVWIGILYVHEIIVQDKYYNINNACRDYVT